MSVLRLAGVVKSYDGVPVLGPLDLTLKEGETTALIGPSGSGKTTLLRLLIGLVRPDEGEVFFGEQSLATANLEAVRLRMGYVVQEGGLFPHLDVRENLTLMARFHRWPRARIEARLEELIGLARLPSELLGRYPLQLSGGQRQRVGLLRALMLDPEVLLLDEPLGALDPLVRVELQDDLAGIFRTLRKTVVLVTHDLGEAAFFGGDLVLLRGGHIVQKGRAADLIDRPADPFVTAFVRAQRLVPAGHAEGTR